MYLLVSILTVIAAVILIFIVVIQNSKGGGLAAGFSSSNQVMGVRKTTDFLEKATWSLAGAIVVLSIVASLFIQHKPADNDSSIRDEIQNSTTTDPNAVPDFGTPVPQDQGGESATPAPQTTSPSQTTAPAQTTPSPAQTPPPPSQGK